MMNGGGIGRWLVFLAALTMSSQGAEWGIILSADVAGEIRPCATCPTDTALGGAARRSSLLRAHPDQVLWLDAGNAFFGPESLGDRGARAAEITARLSYHAVNLSWRDFRFGADHTRKLLDDHEIPAISCNLADEATGRLLVPAYRIADLGGRRLGVIGAAYDPPARQSLPSVRAQLEGITVLPSDESVAKAVAALKNEGVSEFVLLFYGPVLEGLKLAERQGAAALGLGGRRGPDDNKPFPILSVEKERGQAVCIWESGENPRQQLLDPSIPDDPEIVALVGETMPEQATVSEPAQHEGSAPEGANRQSSGNRGLELTIEGITVRDSYGSEKPLGSGASFLVLDVTLKNRIDPELVFDRGIEEAITLHALRVQGAFLHWNGERVLSLQGRLQMQPGHLPDLFTLDYAGARRKGQLVFEVPAAKPDRGATLVLAHELFGTLEVDLFEVASGQPAAKAGLSDNGDLHLKVNSVSAEDGVVAVELSGHGARRKKSPVAEGGDHLLPINLSGLRLYVPGEDPIAPELPAESLPIVFLPERPATHRLRFRAPDSAEVLSLVLPVRPASPSKEPYWILPLRGDTPSLANSALKLPLAKADPEEERAGGSPSPQGSPSKRPPAEKPKREYTPPWPDPPEMQPVHAERTAATEQRLSALDARDDAVARQPALKPETPAKLDFEVPVAAAFAKTTDRHYYLLEPLGDADRLTDIVAVPTGERPVQLALYAGWPSERAMNRITGNALPELRVGQPLLLEVALPSNEPQSYKLIWQATGRHVEAGREFEPNRLAVPSLLPRMLPRGENSFELHGQLHAGDRADFFVLEAREPALATLELRTEGGGMIQFHTGAGRELVQGFSGADRRLFLPDIYVLPGPNIFSVDAMQGDYTVRATLHPAPGPDHEFEPNDEPGFAHRIFPGSGRRGRLPGTRDRDSYYFTWHGSGPVRIRARAGEGGDIEAQIRRENIEVFASERASEVDAVVDLERGHYDLLVQCQKPSLQTYTLRLEHANPFRGTTPEAQDGVKAGPLRLEIEAERDTAAPFSFTPQRIAARLSITSTAAAPIELELEARSSHAGCLPRLETSEVTVPAGGELNVPLDLRIRSDAHADGPVVITCAATGPDTFVTGEWTLSFPINAPPTRETWKDVPLPDELMGAFDVAHTGFGAQLFEPQNAATLFDGIAVGRAFRGAEAVVDLAGDVPVSLAGCLLGLHGAALNRCVKEFEIAVSTDGAAYHPVLKADTELRFDEQAFVFDEPVMATHARVRLLNGHFLDTPKELELGIVKLLAAREAPPLFPQGANLADPKLGYHVVFSDAGELVAGFHHNRLAQIEALRLERYATIREDFPVRVEVSEVSPFGPWTSLGRFAAASKEGVAAALPAPVRARFLRFSGDWKRPNHLSVAEIIESETDDTYRSILAEWGGQGTDAFFESGAAPRAAEPLERPKSSPSAPLPLPPGKAVEGVTWLDLGWEDHYQLEIPPGSGAVQLKLTGSPFVRSRIEATRPAGEALTVHSTMKPGGQEAVYSIRPLPDGPVRIRVHETPRHLAVVWDDSGSVAQFVPGLHRMLRDFAFSVNPESERVQLTPLHQGSPEFLLEGWARDPYSIQQAIRFYHPTGSSASYKTLDFVLDELAKVDGNRVLLIMTDENGDRTSYAPGSIERKLAEVAPAVFSFHTYPGLGADPLHSPHIDHMQTWAAIGGGRYTMLRAPWELDTAISRVQAWLRRPAGYRLEMTAISNEPGFVTVTADPGGSKDRKETIAFGAAGVEVILDASGSMLKRMPDGKRRIDVAKAVLVDLVNDKLPEQAPFALRVFGNREADSCRTDLEIPLAPLQRSRALTTIRSLRAINLARTPIAKSLAAVPRDLADAEGKKVVVLITDGEETCDGDPRAVIRQLAAAGFEVEINIIGFAIDDEVLNNQFREWSKLGGGDYFSANDSAQLSESLERSLQPLFELVDPAGATVAEGRVNGPRVSAPPGLYRVRLKSGKAMEASVEVEPGKEIGVRLEP